MRRRGGEETEPNVRRKRRFGLVRSQLGERQDAIDSEAGLQSAEANNLDEEDAYSPYKSYVCENERDDRGHDSGIRS